MKAEQQILTASVLGTIACLNGRKRIPAHDPELMQMLEGRKVGETPEGELSTPRIMELWLENWDLTNLKA